MTSPFASLLPPGSRGLFAEEEDGEEEDRLLKPPKLPQLEPIRTRSAPPPVPSASAPSASVPSPADADDGFDADNAFKGLAPGGGTLPTDPGRIAQYGTARQGITELPAMVTRVDADPRSRNPDEVLAARLKLQRMGMLPGQREEARLSGKELRNEKLRQMGVGVAEAGVDLLEGAGALADLLPGVSGRAKAAAGLRTKLDERFPNETYSGQAARTAGHVGGTIASYAAQNAAVGALAKQLTRLGEAASWLEATGKVGLADNLRKAAKVGDALLNPLGKYGRDAAGELTLAGETARNVVANTPLNLLYSQSESAGMGHMLADMAGDDSATGRVLGGEGVGSAAARFGVETAGDALFSALFGGVPRAAKALKGSSGAVGETARALLDGGSSGSDIRKLFPDKESFTLFGRQPVTTPPGALHGPAIPMGGGENALGPRRLAPGGSAPLRLGAGQDLPRLAAGPEPAFDLPAQGPAIPAPGVAPARGLAAAQDLPRLTRGDISADELLASAASMAPRDMGPGLEPGLLRRTPPESGGSIADDVLARAAERGEASRNAIRDLGILPSGLEGNGPRTQAFDRRMSREIGRGEAAVRSAREQALEDLAQRGRGYSLPSGLRRGMTSPAVLTNVAGGSASAALGVAAANTDDEDLARKLYLASGLVGIGTVGQSLGRTLYRGLRSGAEGSFRGGSYISLKPRRGSIRLGGGGAGAEAPGATFPFEARSVGTHGYVTIPDGARTNATLEVRHLRNIVKLAQEADEGLGSVRTTKGRGLFSDDTSPNRIGHYPQGADERALEDAAIMGLATGQDAQMLARPVRAGDAAMAPDGFSGVTASVEVQGVGGQKLRAKDAYAIIQRAQANGLAGATFDAGSGTLNFHNVQGFAEGEMKDGRVFTKAVQDAVGSSGVAAKAVPGQSFVQYMDGPQAYIKALGDGPDAPAAYRRALAIWDKVEPEYMDYARRVGADLEATAMKLRGTRDLIEGSMEALEREHGPFGRMAREIAATPRTSKEAAAALAERDTAERLKNARGPVNLANADPAARRARAIKLGTEDVREAIDLMGAAASQWYTKQQKEARAMLQAMVPDLRGQPGKQFVADSILAITSNGQNVASNLSTALPIIRQYLKTGQVSFLDVEKGTTLIKLPRPQRAGTHLDVMSNTRAEAMEQNLRKLQLMLDQYAGKHGSEDTALKMVADLMGRRFLDDSKKGRPMSAELYGPKIGRFLLNLMGQGEEVTVDLWAARTWFRWQGYDEAARSEIDRKTGKLVLRGGPAGKEGDEIRRAFTSLARRITKETGMDYSPSDVQALLWYLEKANYGRWGSPSDLSSFADVGYRFLHGGEPPAPKAANSPAGRPWAFDMPKAAAGGFDNAQIWHRMAEQEMGLKSPPKGPRTIERRDALAREIKARYDGGKLYGLGATPAAVGGAAALGAESMEEGGDGLMDDDRVQKTVRGAVYLGLAAAGYKYGGKRLGIQGAKGIANAMAKTEAGRAALNLISRDILAKPELKELVQAATTEMRKYSAIGHEAAARARGLNARYGAKASRKISDIIEQEALEPSFQMSPEDLKAAVGIADWINTQVTSMGHELVDTGVLTEATRASREGRYLPRMYAAFEGEGSRGQVLGNGTKKEFSVRPYHRRDDNLSLARRAELGEIREADFRVSEAFERGGRNIASARLYNAIADLPGVVEPSFKQVMDNASQARRDLQNARASMDALSARRRDLLKQEATMRQNKVSTQDPARLALRQDLAQVRRDLEALNGTVVGGKRTGGTIEALEADLARFRGEARQISRAHDKAGGDWVSLPDTDSMGALRGAVVDRETYNYLSKQPSLTNPGGAAQKLMRFWKTTMTVRNPGTHVANFGSNILKLNQAGMSPNAQRRYAGRAVRDLMTYGPATKALAEAGVAGGHLPLLGTMPNATNATRRTGLRALARDTRPETLSALADRGIKPMGKVEHGLRSADNVATQLYGAEDTVFRVAYYQYLTDKGMKNEEALKEVVRALPLYDTQSPTLEFLRNTVSPFILYPAKYIPSLLDDIVKHPVRWALTASTWGALDQVSRHQYGAMEETDLDPDERMGPFGYLLPGRIQVDAIARPAMKALGIETRDDAKYTFNPARFTPLSSITDARAPAAASAKLIPGLPELLNPTGPLMDIGAYVSNTDPFTGEDYFRPEDDARDRAGKALKALAGMTLPSAASFHIPRVVGDLRAGNTDQAAIDAMGLVGLRPQMVVVGGVRRRAERDRDAATRGAKARLNADLRKARSDAAIDRAYRRYNERITAAWKDFDAVTGVEQQQ